MPKAGLVSDPGSAFGLLEPCQGRRGQWYFLLTFVLAFWAIAGWGGVILGVSATLFCMDGGRPTRSPLNAGLHTHA